MSFEIFPFTFTLDLTAIAGAVLWSLALYLGLTPLADWVAAQLARWFAFAERSMYLSEEEFEKSRSARESQNAFYGSVLGIIPFLAVGPLFYYAAEIGFGDSWGLSLGTLACFSCGLYELGRRSNIADEANESDE
jgi:hypothetical protein